MVAGAARLVFFVKKLEVNRGKRGESRGQTPAGRIAGTDNCGANRGDRQLRNGHAANLFEPDSKCRDLYGYLNWPPAGGQALGVVLTRGRHLGGPRMFGSLWTRQGDARGQTPGGGEARGQTHSWGQTHEQHAHEKRGL